MHAARAGLYYAFYFDNILNCARCILFLLFLSLSSYVNLNQQSFQYIFNFMLYSQMSLAYSSCGPFIPFGSCMCIYIILIFASLWFICVIVCWSRGSWIPRYVAHGESLPSHKLCSYPWHAIPLDMPQLHV